MKEEKIRLTKLIEHWAEHNDEHRARFREVAREASRMKFPETAYELEAAAKAGGNVSEHLRLTIEKIRHLGLFLLGG